MIIVLAVLLVVVGVGTAAELYVRHRVTSCLTDAAATAVGGPVDIGLSRKPLLLSLVDRKVPYLTADSDNAAFDTPGGPQLTDLRAQARFNGVHLPGSDGRGGYLDSSVATVSWPTQAIASSVRAQAFGGLVTQLSTDGGTLRVQFLGGLGTTTLRPIVQAGRIVIETVDVRVFGLGLPTSPLQQVVNLLSGNLSTFPLGLTPTAVRVTDVGVEITLAGGGAELPPLHRDPSACSSF